MAQHPWAQEDHVHPWRVDSDDEKEPPDPETDPTAAMEMYLEALLSLYYKSKILAERITTLCYWNMKMGLGGDIAKLAKRPGSGDYQEHLDEVLGFGMVRSHLYKFKVPGHRRYALTRAPVEIQALPVHEAFDNHIKEQGDSIRVALELAKLNKSLPPTYFKHPVVKAHPLEPVYAYNIFIDAVKYTNSDSVTGVWLMCLLTGKRFLSMLIRKRCLCQCGCRCWCTWFGVL